MPPPPLSFSSANKSLLKITKFIINSYLHIILLHLKQMYMIHVQMVTYVWLSNNAKYKFLYSWMGTNEMTEDPMNQGRKLTTSNLPRIERRTNNTHTIPVLQASINSQLTYYGKIRCNLFSRWLFILAKAHRT